MNSKIDEFKQFVKTNPFLIGYIRNGSKTWQEFYEIYDLYGDDEEAWEKLLTEEETKKKDVGGISNRGNYIEDLINMAKRVDMDKVQEGISSLQKTLGLFGELFAGKNSTATKGTEYNPRPLYKRFED